MNCHIVLTVLLRLVQFLYSICSPFCQYVFSNSAHGKRFTARRHANKYKKAGGEYIPPADI